MRQLKFYFLYVAGKLRRHFFLQYPETERDWQISRVGFIINSAASTCISTLIGGAFFAALLRELGVTDAVNGILSAIPVLASATQILALQITKHINKVKFITCITCITFRLLYVVLVVVPFLPIPGLVKTPIFVALFVLCSILGQFIGPCSSEWIVSVIPMNIRGKYIGLKDSVTVATGSVCSLVGAKILDYYTEIGNVQNGFQIIGILIFIFAIIDNIGLNMAKEPKHSRVVVDGHEAMGRIAKKHGDAQRPKSLKQIFIQTLTDKKFRTVIILYIFWYVAVYMTVPFLSIYQISDLGLQYTFISVVAFIATFARVFLTPVIGRFADRFSFMFLVKIGTAITGISFISSVLCAPGPMATTMFTIYTILYSIGTGIFGVGIAGAMYSIIPMNDCAGHFAINTTITGVTGFLVSILAGFLVDFFQKKEFFLGSVHVFAQQILSLISMVVLIFQYIYVLKMEKINAQEDKKNTGEK